jgi:hypothetical protein
MGKYSDFKGERGYGETYPYPINPQPGKTFVLGLLVRSDMWMMG